MTTPFYKLPLLSLDTETTGVNPWECSIVTCNMTYDIPGKDPIICDWLIDPKVPIPEGASAVHGVTNEIAQQYGMSPEVGLQSIADHLNAWRQHEDEDGYPLPIVVYNAPYDLTLLKNEFIRYGIKYEYGFISVIDPLVLDKQLDKYRKGKRQLSLVAQHYGVELNNAHSADADSMASVKIARAIGEKFKIDVPMAEVYAKQIEFKAEQSKSLQEYFRKKENDPNLIISGEWPVQTMNLGA